MMKNRYCFKGIVVIVLVALLKAGPYCRAQVAPAEIRDPGLKAVENEYMSQLVAVNRALSGVSFPFSFVPSRYAGLNPKDQIGSDTRGLEFVHFHGRMVLKLTGNYNAAFSTRLLTPNQRAGRVFEDVVAPVLRLLPDYFSERDHFEAFGFEIAYHTRTSGHGYDYEGKEILVLVMSKPDALACMAPQARLQEVLNRSEIYLNGEPFGLALGARDPFDVEALPRSLPAAFSRPGPPPAEAAPIAAPSPGPDAKSAAPSGLDPDGLQKEFQSQLDELGREGVAKYHFVDYAPPSLVVVRNQIAIQLTMKNPVTFDREATSIYRRAAQSFDLFLAPQLKPILDKLPPSAELAEADVTVIDQLAGKSGSSSEAVEYIFPLKALRSFAAAEITNQALIDQSLVLVNGVRIALNLQQVE